MSVSSDPWARAVWDGGCRTRPPCRVRGPLDHVTAARHVWHTAPPLSIPALSSVPVWLAVSQSGAVMYRTSYIKGVHTPLRTVHTAVPYCKVYSEPPVCKKPFVPTEHESDVPKLVVRCVQSDQQPKGPPARAQA